MCLLYKTALRIYKIFQEFLVQLLHEEKAKAEMLLQSTPGGVREQEMSASLLADPLVFVRRWIGEVRG